MAIKCFLKSSGFEASISDKHFKWILYPYARIKI